MFNRVVDRIKNNKDMVKSTRVEVVQAKDQIESSRTILYAAQKFLLGEIPSVDIASIIEHGRKNGRYI
jgi:hypothetical protein